MKFRLIVDKTREEEITATVHAPSALTEKVEALVLEYAGRNKLVAYTEDDLLPLTFDQVECITVVNGKTYAIDTQGRQLRLKQRLYELEQILPSCFIRINKSAIANETRLVKFTAAYSGAVNAQFQSGYEEYVSRRCFAAIKRRYEVK